MRYLSDVDVAGAIAELTTAVGQLATHAGYNPRQLAPSAAQQAEIVRLCGQHPRMLSSVTAPAPEPDFRQSRAAAEVDRLQMTHPREFRSSSQLLALTSAGLSSATAERVRGSLRARGLPASLLDGSSDPVRDLIRLDRQVRTAALAGGQVLVRDVTDDPSEDISSLVGSPTHGLGDDDPSYNPDPDTGPDVSGFGQQGNQVLTPDGAALEVSRVVRQYASQISGLQPRAVPRDQAGRFASKVPVPMPSALSGR